MFAQTLNPCLNQNLPDSPENACAGAGGGGGGGGHIPVLSFFFIQQFQYRSSGHEILYK